MSSEKSKMERFYPESRFGGYTDVDGTVSFYTRIRSLCDSNSTVVDFGCGRGAHADDQVATRRNLVNLKGSVGRVIGLDVDAAGEANPFLDEFHPLVEGRWPLEDDSVDLCLTDSVLEHVPEPEQFFSEARRVLRPGGHLCIRTPNRWSYVSVGARIVPNRLHEAVLKRVEENTKDEDDIFPTLFRCNSLWTIRRMLREHGFDGVVYGYEAEPNYLRFSLVAYWLGVVYQRFAPGFLRTGILAYAQLVGAGRDAD